MKLKTIVRAFPAITTVYDSLEFKRTWELRKAYKELKEAVTLFEENQKDLILSYNNDGKVPENKQVDYDKKLTACLDSDIHVSGDAFLRFTKEEVEKSEIPGSKLVNIMDHFLLDPPEKQQKKKEE